MSKNQRTRQEEARAWALIVYPESAPKDWQDKLNELHIKWACSPLHDKDIDETATEDGKPRIKKAHYHIILQFDGKKSFKQVSEISKMLNTVIPQVCHSVPSAVRYFLHLDNPDKYQYDIAEAKAFGGFELDKYLEMTVTQKNAVCKEILNVMVKYHITEFADLFVTAMLEERQDWLSVMMQANYLRSIELMARSLRHSMKIPCDVLTGELADVEADAYEGAETEDIKEGL